jgi:antitoxin component YwqK of YwqJK toxin-antitoxin module
VRGKILLALGLLAGCDQQINGFQLDERDGVYYVRNESKTFTGQATWSYSKERPRVRAIFREGRFHGLAQWWYPNGVPQTRVKYKNGRLDGPAQSWHKNGQIKFQGTFVEGERDGLNQSWHDNGRLKKSIFYRQGERLECQAWDEEGIPTPCE